MKKKIFLAFFLALLAPAFAAADTGNVLKISGMLDNEPAARDGNPDTFTTLKRKSVDAPFVIYVYPAEIMIIEKVVITGSAAIDAASVEIAHSLDIVNWEDRAFDVKKTEDDGRFAGTFEMKIIKQTQYLRVRFKPEDKTAVEMKLYEIEISTKDAGENKIENIRVVDIGKHTAAVEYSTPLAAASQVRFSPWRPEMSRVLVNQSFATEHHLILEDLLEGTDYYYQVLLPEEGAMSKVMTFRTEGKPLPIILEINLAQLAPNGAKIFLTGNTGLNWKVYFGESEAAVMNAETAKSNSRGRVAGMEGFAESRVVEMESLKPRTRYYFLIEVADDEGRKTESELHGFDTPPLNLALGKPVEGTFRSELADPYITPSTNPMGRVTDGDETYFSGFAKSVDPNAYKQFAMVDLEEIKEVAEIVVVWSRLGIPEEYTVQVDDGDLKWQTVLEVNAAGMKPETAKLSERRSLRGDPLVDVAIPVNRKFKRMRLDAPMGVKILSKFDFEVAIIAEMKAQAP